MSIKLFVVWDFTTKGLRITLESLHRNPPDGWSVEVPGLSYEAGTIFDKVVRQGIPQAERVLVVTDRPNANVGFEAGLAMGLGKQVLFAHLGRDLPAWSSEPPLGNYLQGSFKGIGQLEELLWTDSAWLPARRASPLDLDGPCLDLCPAHGEGEALRRVRLGFPNHDWMRPPEQPFSVLELEERFGRAARLVWTIANFGQDADERDGAENAANGILAGWFFARCGTLDSAERNARFSAIRMAGSREVADIHLFEKEVDSLSAYQKRLEHIENTWRVRRKRVDRGKASILEQVPSRDTFEKRVAVLAFKDVVRSADNHGYGEGFTERVIGDLLAVTNRHSGIKLIPRQNVIRMEEQNTTIAQLGADLNAHYVLEGSFDRSEEPCVFSARLIDVEKEEYLPQERFSQDWTLHERASRRVAEYTLDQLLQMRPEDHQMLAERPVRDHVAVMAFWSGQNQRRQFNNLRQPRSFTEAEAQFKRAFSIDPNYREALSELGFLYILHWETDSRPKWLEESRRVWERVREQDLNDSFALAELGYLEYVERRDAWNAVRLARLAVDANPEHAFAHNVLALLYLYLGYYETNEVIEREEVFERALGYLYPYTNVALALQLLGRHEEALELTRGVRELEPRALVALLVEGAQHYYRGDFAEAEAVWAEGEKVCPSPVASIFQVTRGWVRAKEGRVEAARRLVEEHRSDSWVRGPYGPYYISLCALAGLEDVAIELLEREVTFASNYRYLVSEPTLRPLADNPRFRILLDRRHNVWTRTLDDLRAFLPAPPAEPPAPEAFLSGITPRHRTAVPPPSPSP